MLTGTANKISIWNMDKMICVDTFEDLYSPGGEVTKRLVALKRGKAVFSSADNSICVYHFDFESLSVNFECTKV